MPISAPAIPASTAPMTIARTRRRTGSSIWKALCIQPETMIPVKAPMLMKPA